MILGLTGYAQSGKDTVAQTLIERYGFTRIAFADKIRELLYEMDPPVPSGVGNERHIVGLQNYVDIYGWDVSKQNPIVRSMLQNLGVGARKVFGEWFWIEQALPFVAAGQRCSIGQTSLRPVGHSDAPKLLIESPFRQRRRVAQLVRAPP